jgi:hypothetical protein
MNSQLRQKRKIKRFPVFSEDYAKELRQLVLSSPAGNSKRVKNERSSLENADLKLSIIY